MRDNQIVSIIPQQRWVLISGGLRKTYEILSQAENEGIRLDEGEGFVIERVTETRTYLPFTIVQKINKTFILPTKQ